MDYINRLIFVGLLAFIGSCDDDTAGGADMSARLDMSAMCTGGPATGPQDNHCFDDGGANLVAVDPAECSVDAGDTGGGDTFPEPMYNTSGNDDDCKYAVSYTVGGICRNSDTFFTVTLKDAIMNQPVQHATDVRAEVFLTDTHPANTSAATTTETSPGVYKIGPIKFDMAGKWTVRFHFFENCTDTETSPHGHAAFFVNVP